MTRADEYFIDQVTQILNNGFLDIDYKVRARWADGTPAHTKKIFSYTTRYDLSKEFPILTLRQQAFKNVVKETLWIFQKKSDNIRDLDSHIWDSWADENGSVGKTYGYVAGEKYNYPEGYMDQIDNVLYQLQNNPMDRRMMIQLFRPEYIKESGLPPCVMTYMFDVADGKLNMYVLQRSADVLAAGAAGGWDEIESALLQHMFAQVSGLEVGELVHTCNNLHIYDRHIPFVESIITKPSYKVPKLWINPDIKNFYDFTVDDFQLVDYEANKTDIKFEVAI